MIECRSIYLRRITVLLLLIAGTAITVEMCGYVESRFHETEHNYFSHLGSSFIHGRLDTPELREQLDVSTYDGKTYLYWGPVGGVVFGAVSLFCDSRVSDRVIATMLLVVNFGLWWRIAMRLFPLEKTPLWELMVLVGFTWWGGLFITMFQYPGVWQMGHILCYTGLSLAVFGLAGPKLRPNVAAFGYCFAVMSRSSMLILAPGFAVLTLVLLHRENMDLRQTLLAMLVPSAMVAATLCLLACYNFARFDDPRVRSRFADNASEGMGVLGPFDWGALTEGRVGG